MSPIEYNLRIGLEGYDLLQVEETKQLTLHVELKRELKPSDCPYCGACRLHSKGRYQREVRHLSCFGHAGFARSSTVPS